VKMQAAVSRCFLFAFAGVQFCRPASRLRIKRSTSDSMFVPLTQENNNRNYIFASVMMPYII
jgi:hypothetical protein